jgi:membrane-associated phospholipid phosphatase
LLKHKLVIFLILLGIFSLTFFDLYISIYLFNSKSLFAIFGLRFGQFPAYILLFLCIFLLFVKKYRKYSEFYIFLFFLTIIIIRLLKFSFGRVRFIDLDYNYNNFTFWFVINGFSNQNHSFPSKHTAMSLLTISLIIPIVKSNLNDYLKKAFIFIIFIWCILIPISRIIAGAHYFSDILFSVIIVIFLMYLLSKIFEIDIKK